MSSETKQGDRSTGVATVWDVAHKAGVSAMTVSRVINGNASVSDKTREKVNRAIQELNYQVNVAARAARIGTLRVGLLTATRAPHSSAPSWSAPWANAARRGRT
jgi:LacI family transcriptional regulator